MQRKIFIYTYYLWFALDCQLKGLRITMKTYLSMKVFTRKLVEEEDPSLLWTVSSLWLGSQTDKRGKTSQVLCIISSAPCELPVSLPAGSCCPEGLPSTTCSSCIVTFHTMRTFNYAVSLGSSFQSV